MRVGVFGKLETPEIGAFMRGCEALSCSAALRNPAGLAGQPEDCFDVICVNGMQGNCQMMVALYAEQGVPAIVIDLGYIYRPDYFQLGWQGINRLPAGPFDSARALSMFDDIPQTAKHGGSYVLVCGQKQGDRQHNLPDVRAWAKHTIAALKKVSSEPIKFRPHPLYRFHLDKTGVAFSDPKTESLHDALIGARCLVTHNSTSAIEALLFGVPVFCSSSAMYAEFCNTSLEAFDSPCFHDPTSFFNRLAYGQWTLDEIADGKALQFLLTTKHEAFNAIC